MKAKAPLLAVTEAALVVAWSSGFIGARLAADVSSVFPVLFWRFAVTALVLAPLALRLGRTGLPMRSIAIQAALGATGMFGYLALGVKAIELGVAPGTAALISALQPLATVALAGPLLAERVTGRQWAGLMLGLGGVALAVGGALGNAPLWAYALSLLSAASLVMATLLAKAFPDATPLLPSLAIQSAVSALLFVPLAALGGGLLPPLDMRFVGAVAWFILFSTMAGYGLYWLCLRRSTVTHVGSLIFLTPPVTMLWAWLMFDEPVAPSAVAGFVVCMVGVVLTRVSAAAASAS